MSDFSVQIEGMDRLLREVERLPSRVQGGVSTVIGRYQLRIERTAKKLVSQPGTGRTYTRGGTTHRASAPGDPPATDTGNLRNRIHSKLLSPLSAEVVSGASYSLPLEHGTGHLSDYDGQPISLSDIQSIRLASSSPVAREFGTSAMAPRPFMRPAAKEHASDFLRDTEKTIEKAVEAI